MILQNSQLISIYGIAVDRNWFSKLEVVEDVENGEIKLKASNNFIRDWVNQNYFHVIENVISKEQFKSIFLLRY